DHDLVSIFDKTVFANGRSSKAKQFGLKLFSRFVQMQHGLAFYSVRRVAVDRQSGGSWGRMRTNRTRSFSQSSSCVRETFSGAWQPSMRSKPDSASAHPALSARPGSPSNLSRCMTGFRPGYARRELISP